MIGLFSATSWTFTLPALLALVLLSVHAVKTKGWLFGLIWLALPAVLVDATALLLAFSPRSQADWLAKGVIFPGTADASIFLVTAFYLSALLGKGFVERTRCAGSGVALAAVSAACAALFVFVLSAANARVVYGRAHRIDGACVSMFWSRLGFEMMPAFPVAFVAGVFLYVLAYRLVSLRTQRNGVKLAVLSALSPVFVAAACGIGLLAER
jgi:hypothetical protein